jgi:predicted DNA-binding transcriptional regulator YafY
MRDLRISLKRRIELVGMCLDAHMRMKPVDFAGLFNCEELTIKRDLQALRSYGIDIHSVARKGVIIENPPDQRQLKELITQYIGLSNSVDTFDKATVLMIKRQKRKALSYVVNLQRCIEERNTAVIDYLKDSEEEEKGKEICPLQIFQSDGYWRVLAVNDGRVKQYHLNKLTRVQPTTRKFRRPPQEEIDDMFRHSFRSWIGSDKHRIRIWLSRVWAERLKPKQLMETEVITENDDGSIVFETTVNSLEEVASWVVSRGEGVVVMEPVELKERVVNIARGALKNYTD